MLGRSGSNLRRRAGARSAEVWAVRGPRLAAVSSTIDEANGSPVSERPDPAALLADPPSVPHEQIPDAIGELEKAKAMLWARLMVPARDIPRMVGEFVTALLRVAMPAERQQAMNGDANAADRDAGRGDWITAGVVRNEYHWSDRTIRRRIHVLRILLPDEDVRTDLRLASFGCKPRIIKCALTRADIKCYHLPPDFTKKSDTRRAAFVARHGDVAVELDALPVDVLRGRLVEEVERRMDLRALKRVRGLEARERQRLATLLSEAR